MAVVCRKCGTCHGKSPECPRPKTHAERQQWFRDYLEAIRRHEEHSKNAPPLMVGASV